MVISFGKIGKKYFIYLLILILISISFNLNNIYFEKNENQDINNIFLRRISAYGLLVFLIIPEYIIRKKYINNNDKKKEREALANMDNLMNKKIDFLFNPTEQMTLNNFLILICGLVFIYVYKVGFDIYYEYYNERIKLDSTEYECSMEIIYLIIIFKIANKTIFYKHQYLSLFVLSIIELTRYVINLVVLEKIEFDFTKDFYSFFPLIFFSFFESGQYYLINKFMKYKYFSPLSVAFLIGCIFVFFSIIMLIIFLNVTCLDPKICPALTELPNIFLHSYIFLLIRGILYTGIITVTFLIIKEFSVFHLFPYTSLDEFISHIFFLSKNFEIFRFIMIIIAFPIEIFSIFVFTEIIELNFCGLNKNLKKNIINRADNEAYSIYDDMTSEEDEGENHDTRLTKNLDSVTDDISVY